MDSSEVAEVIISALPEAVSKPKIIKELKLVTSRTSSELMKMLEVVPISIECKSRSSAIKLVRGLRSLGISCHVSI